MFDVEVLVISIPIILLFALRGIAPAFAKEVVKKTKSASSTAVKGAKAIATTSKPPPLCRKVLEGANTTGGFKKWKAGQYYTYSTNMFMSLILLGLLIAFR